MEVIEKEKDRESFAFPVRCRERTERVRSRGTMGTHGMLGVSRKLSFQ